MHFLQTRTQKCVKVSGSMEDKPVQFSQSNQCSPVSGLGESRYRYLSVESEPIPSADLSINNPPCGRDELSFYI